MLNLKPCIIIIITETSFLEHSKYFGADVTFQILLHDAANMGNGSFSGTFKRLGPQHAAFAFI